MDGKKGIREKIHRKGLVSAAAMLAVALLFSACGSLGAQTGNEAVEPADFFVYTDEGNRLYLWKQGAEEAVLLTDCAFARSGEDAEREGSVGEGNVESAGNGREDEKEGGAEDKSNAEERNAGKASDVAEENNAKEEGNAKATSIEEAQNKDGTDWKYWEEWEYWEEWNERDRRWVGNDEKALEAVVQEGADHSLYFPQRMRWESFGMEKSLAEQEEEREYIKDKEVDSCAGIRIFLYDLYRYDASVWEGEAGEAEKVADNIFFYQTDKAGNVWYCKAVENGTRRIDGEEYIMVRCMLYRYDGEEHLEVAEVNSRRNGAFFVSDDGGYVVFYAPDDGLYGCKLGEEAELLAEKVDSSYYMGSSFYADANMENIIYASDNTIYMISGRKKENERQLAGEGEILFAGLMGEGEERVFLLELMEGQSYADWILREEGKEDADTKRLWELMERAEQDFYPFLCRASVIDYSSPQMECICQMDGYVLSCPTFDGIESPRKVYYIEMIPTDSFQKFTLSELLGEKTPADVLEAYAYCQGDYGEGNEGIAIAEALESCWNHEAIEKRGKAYAVTIDGIHWLEEAGIGSWPESSDYGESGDVLFPMDYVDVGLEWTYSNYSSRFYYGYREDRYALDAEGNCRKIVEAADETAVRGDEVFYSRTSGLEGAVKLYRTSMDGCVAEMVSVSMESMKKSAVSDAVLFLTGGLLPEEEEEEIHIRSREELEEIYGEAAKDMGDADGENAERTLVLCDGNGVRELEKQVRQYGFYGMDSVWMLQYEEEMDDEGLDGEGLDGEGLDGEGADGEEMDWFEDWEEDAGAWDNGRGCGRLQVYEEGEKKQIAERAVWVIESVFVSGTGKRMVTRTVWYFE